ncbi:MAG: hypothetical protein AVDCRST_MAG91-477 [uncultured Sphingomonadaceae bacterium]|uniref:Antitoxin n=1 Tax=uncultured Sphingomonadaceae bacterium TaxID=169976 RepID=A0A6J4SDK2_9SPHN|nr:MAG: hypothetical protein AVDCRST_MAG91-477 [uncultured Sphingomonadaceae bacterium]
MGKMVGAAEFKANCLRILDEVERTGEPVTITKRGRVVGELHPPKQGKKESPFGFMKGQIRILGDIESPLEPDWEEQWEANNPVDLYR